MSVRFLHLAANYSGQIWTAFISLFAIPVYISFLGLEQYGLLSIFLLFQSCLPLLDMGLGPTLIREISIVDTGSYSKQHLADILRTIEFASLILSSFLLFIFLLLSPVISASVSLNSSSFSVDSLLPLIRLMGVALSLRLFDSIYRSNLVGLHQHVTLNLLQIIRISLATFGSFGIFAFVYPSIYLYLLWQIIVTLIFLVIQSALVYSRMSISLRQGHFRLSHLLRFSRYSIGMALISLIAFIFTQFDKLVLVRIISLDDFAVYSIAFTLANSLTLLISPITVSFFPYFCSFLATHQRKRLINSFHTSAQLVSSISSSFAATLSLSAFSLLTLWTGRELSAQSSAPILIILAFAIMFNTLLAIPCQLQSAYGWTSLGLRINSILLFLFIPLSLILSSSFNSIGAATALLILNFLILVFNSSYMFKKIIKSQWRSWLVSDVLLPILPTVTSCILIFSSPLPLRFSSQLTLLSFSLLIFLFFFALSIIFSSRLRPIFGFLFSGHYPFKLL